MKKILERFDLFLKENNFAERFDANLKQYFGDEPRNSVLCGAFEFAKQYFGDEPRDPALIERANTTTLSFFVFTQFSPKKSQEEINKLRELTELWRLELDLYLFGRTMKGDKFTYPIVEDYAV